METERLTIDPIRATDKEDYYFNISHNKKVLETFICRYADTLEEFDFTSYPGRSDLYAIRLKVTGRLIGILSLFDEKDGSCEIGYGIGSNHWNQGYATEAASRFLEYLFREKGLKTVYASFFPENNASRRVLEKCGMAYDHYSEKELTYLGVERDLIYYAIRSNCIMNKYIACCGLDCENCEARLATVNNDDVLRRKVAANWSELNGVRITPEMIHCSGCRIDGVKTLYCDSLCPIRACVRKKGFDTCASCPELHACKTLGAITANNPAALQNLCGYTFLTLRERPELKEPAAAWFHSKWGVPQEAYLECMNAYLNRETENGWYLCLEGDRIVGGLGVIENDFHDRKDLAPNVCAVYTEETCRGRGIAGRLLNLAVEDMRSKGVSPLYLVTDHTGFYERYGWEFLCMVQGDGEPDLTRMYIHR